MRKIASLIAATLPVVASTQAVAADSAKIEFAPVELPAVEAEGQAILASPEVTIDGNAFAIDHHELARLGDRIGEGVFGRAVDAHGQPAGKGAGMPAGSALLGVASRLVEITSFAGRPGAVYRTDLNQDEVTGELTATATAPVDFAASSGSWQPGAVSPTPWGTALVSEASPPDARALEAANRKSDLQGQWATWAPVARFLGIDPDAVSLPDFKKAFKPYLWGYATEISPAQPGHATAARQYAMGRAAGGQALAMPDSKTVYYSDDAANAGLYMFVADAPGDLSAGRLYALKWKQNSADQGGPADLSWIDLGHAASADIKAAVDGGLPFSGIFETARGDGKAGSCPGGFTAVISADGFECLKLKPGMETVASRLETRRFAAYRGATAQFADEGGLAHDPATRTLYLAVGSIAAAAAQGAGGASDIRVAANPCGAVYGLALGTDAGIGSEYVAKGMAAVLAGRPKAGGAGGCEAEGIANPRSLAVLADSDVLAIGEDGAGHPNDAVWAFEPGSKDLTRILSVPAGFGVPALSWAANVDGWGYLTTTIRASRQGADDQSAVIGHLGPFPAFGPPPEARRRR